jgi:uncharacterized protein YndB with AHSA1/START domain
VRHYSITVDIAAPPRRVFDVMTDVERWHEWTESIASIEKLDAGELHVGSRARVRQPKLPPATWTVTEIIPNKGFTWTSSAPGVLVTASHTVVPKGTGSQATLELHFDGLAGGVLGRLTSGLNEHYLALESSGLKRRSEHPPATARLK